MINILILDSNEKDLKLLKDICSQMSIEVDFATALSKKKYQLYIVNSINTIESILSIYKQAVIMYLTDNETDGKAALELGAIDYIEKDNLTAKILERSLRLCLAYSQELEKRLITQERYDLASSGSAVGIWDWDLKTNDIYIDPNLKTLLGYLDEEIPNQVQAWLNLVYPQDREACLKSAQEHLQGLKPTYEIEHRRLHKDGSIRWFLTRGKVLRDANGKPLRMLGCDTDITKIKQDREILETIINNIPVMITFYEPHGQLKFINKEIEKVFGWNYSELENIDVMAEAFPDSEYRETVLEHMNKADGTWMDMEIKTRFGETIETSWANIKLSDGNYIGIGQDITKRKQTERYFKTLIEIQNNLLKDKDIDYNKILSLLGETSSASRVYFFKNHYEDSRLLVSQKAEWCAEYIYPQIDNPELQNISYDEYFPRWKEILSQGDIISGIVADFPASEREILQPQNILSILILPLIVNEEFYGLIGFDNCLEAVAWESSEIALLEAAASAISLKIKQQFSDIALQKSEEKFRSIFHQAAVGMALVDPTGKFIQVNQTFGDFIGYTETEMLEKTVSEITHPLENYSFNYVKENQKKTLVTEKRYLDKNNQEKWGYVHVSALLDEREEMQYYIAVVNDITIRIQAEKQLEYRLTLQASLAEVSQQLVSHKNIDINQILGIIGSSINANRVYITIYENKLLKVSIIYEWCDSQTIPEINNFKNIDTPPFSWWMNKLKAQENIIIAKVEELEADAEAEKQYLQSVGVKAALGIPIFTQSGELWGCIGCTDSSGRKIWNQEDAQLLQIVGEMIYTHHCKTLAEEKLRASEALYAGIFNHSADGIFMINVENNDEFIYETINPTYEKAIGINSEDITGKTIEEIFPIQIAKTLKRYYKVCVNLGKPISYERPINLAKSNSHEKIWRTIVVPIIDDNGQVVKLQGSARDITSEKKAIAQQIRFTKHQQLLASLTLKIRTCYQIEEILATVVKEIQKTFETDRVLFFRFFPDGNGIVANEAVVKGFPVMLDAIIINQACLLNFAEKYLSGYIHVCPDTLLADFNPCYLEFLKAYQIRANLIMPIMLDSKVWGLLALQQCSSPREWKRDEIELLQQLANQLSIAIYQANLRELENYQRLELARSNTELEHFAYVASHDLQAPLLTISSYIKLLERRYKNQLDAKADKFISHIVQSSQRMQNLINDLLEYSRVGKGDKVFQPTNFQEVIQQAIANLQTLIHKEKAVVNYSFNLPTLMADPFQMVQLLQNLISNALKYRSEKPPLIEFQVEYLDNYWLFSLKDNGIGIAPENTDKIFQIFKRLHTQDEYPGTGIGLAICQKIVASHNGRIWVESELNQGSTFYFTLNT